MAGKKQETPMDRFKKIALWQWGLIVIVAGLASTVVTNVMMPAGGSSAADRGAAFGRAIAGLLFVVVGLVLIAVHFIRKLKK